MYIVTPPLITRIDNMISTTEAVIFSKFEHINLRSLAVPSLPPARQLWYVYAYFGNLHLVLQFH